MLERRRGIVATDIEPYLEIRSARSPALSFDGALVAYLSDESGFNQIWLKPAAGGSPWRLSNTAEPIGTIAFNPKSRDLMFTMDCGGDERHQIWYVPEASGIPVQLTDDPDTVHVWGCWSPDGKRIAFASNARVKADMDIYVTDIATQSTRCVLQGSGFREAVGFSIDGNTLMVRDSSRAMNDQDLYRLDLQTGKTELILQREGRARYLAPKMLKDGSGFLVITDRNREFQGIAFYRFSDRSLTFLATPEAQDVEAIALSPDQSRIAYVVNREGWNRIVVHDRSTGLERTLEGHPAGVIASLVWTPDNQAILFSLEGAATPSDLWRVDPATSAFEQITSSSKAGVDLSSFVEPRVERARSFDGLPIPFLVYEPTLAAPPKGYPAVIIIHGGPEAQWTPTFRPDIQFLLGQGILVVAPNVRGSTGYGRTYQHLDDRELRMDSVADLKAVRLALGARDDVDANRIAIFGRSYGGFMVLSALTEYPELWKLGVEFYGIANFLTLLQTTGPWRRNLRAAEYGDPAEIKAELERFSPIHRIDRIRVPLMIAQGLDDPRVPASESEMVYSCMRGLGQQVDYHRIPHEGHGFARIENRRTVFGALARFLERHL
ncbi:S9 family peptidase [Microvirga brassicacearum]|uniref:S9 family peptidase n=1 Tax=Microvirga brassicacearum TaxID=2580413 RepID=A0A5N3P357_9HYPH|nr:S9 family peptidase [Microvirga brassicacearum]KAB0264154.1 S9 family peptidase [Microvirga brassicacearum]